MWSEVSAGKAQLRLRDHGTLGGLAAHSAPSPPTPAPALRAASPNPPALWRSRDGAGHNLCQTRVATSPSPAIARRSKRTKMPHLRACADCRALLATNMGALPRTPAGAFHATSSELSPPRARECRRVRAPLPRSDFALSNDTGTLGDVPGRSGSGRRRTTCLRAWRVRGVPSLWHSGSWSFARPM